MNYFCGSLQHFQQNREVFLAFSILYQHFSEVDQIISLEILCSFRKGKGFLSCSHPTHPLICSTLQSCKESSFLMILLISLKFYNAKFQYYIYLLQAVAYCTRKSKCATLNRTCQKYSSFPGYTCTPGKRIVILVADKDNSVLNFNVLLKHPSKASVIYSKYIKMRLIKDCKILTKLVMVSSLQEDGGIFFFALGDLYWGELGGEGDVAFQSQGGSAEVQWSKFILRKFCLQLILTTYYDISF